MKIILLGAPGSGKGTQGELMTKAYGFPRISTGDLLRDAVSRGTLLGQQAQSIMERGDLVADDLVVRIVAERTAQPDCVDGYILDGFPRTINQAQMMESMNQDHDEVVIDICLPDEAVISRLNARRICTNCGTIYNLLDQIPKDTEVCDICSGKLIRRDDDKPGVIQDRLKVYHEKTEPLIDHYKAKSSYHAVDGEGSINEVFTRVRRVLDRLMSRTEN